MSSDSVVTHPVPPRLLDSGKCPTPYIDSLEKYRAMWKESVEQPDLFFGKVSSLIQYSMKLVLLHILIICYTARS